MARAAAAAQTDVTTAVTAGATARRALAIYFFPFAGVVGLVLADADPLGVGAGLGPAEFASD